MQEAVTLRCQGDSVVSCLTVIIYSICHFLYPYSLVTREELQRFPVYTMRMTESHASDVVLAVPVLSWFLFAS